TYYEAKGKPYFYELLKPLGTMDNLNQDDFIDWGTEERYQKAIGIGECAGVVIDLIATLLFESEEKIQSAASTYQEGKWAASIYHSYSSMVNSAKALLTAEKTKTNTHASIIKDFDEIFVASNRLNLGVGFSDLVLQINKNEPTAAFAHSYLEDAKNFLETVDAYRKLELINA
ncbi:MAG: HEPN domain-containing protein, partial [Maribacter sp.]|nr:HEPN domain-containing protein [Maribacter sp.]